MPFIACSALTRPPTILLKAPFMASDNSAPSNQGNATPDADSLPIRVLPPALVALAWWFSGVALIRECDGLKDWKIFGLALPVFWLASIGPTRVACHAPWKRHCIAIAALAIGLTAGWLVGSCGVATSYWHNLLYALMHTFITGSLGILLFLAIKPAKDLHKTSPVKNSQKTS